MDMLKKLDTALAGIYKGTPKLSNSAKESLAKAWPWLALIFGVLQLWAAWALYELLRVVDRVATFYGVYVNQTSVYSGKDKFFIYLSLIALVIDAVILLMAYPKLKKRQKSGWNLIFLGAVLNALYGVFNLFVSGRGVGSLLGALIGTAITFYLLYQVKEKYTGPDM